VELNYIIQRVAGVYKSINKNKREKSYSTGSTLPTVTSGDALSVSDSMSDQLSNNESLGHDLGSKSNASPSYCSGFEGSDISSGNGRSGHHKQGVEIVALSGPGGVGKSTLFNSVQNVARKQG
jgi:Mrp family chromosome partitioning ATPase